MAYSPKQKRVTFTVLLLGMALVGCRFVRMMHPGAPPDFSDSRSVYRFAGGRWTSLPHLRGGTEGIEISRSGSVWATAPGCEGIERWDGTRWVHYRGSDFGATSNELPGGFAVQGDAVWAATNDGVAQFDGRRWRLYPEAVKTPPALATAAGLSGVWVLDDDGNLAHFDGERWSFEDLKDSPVAADWKKRLEEDVPELRVTGDGAVWLMLRALWRRDGAGWHEVRRGDSDWDSATMIGQGGDSVWLGAGSSMLELKPDGSTARSFDQRDLPIQEGAAIYRLAVSGGRIWLATTKDLLAFDGKQWQRFGIPPGTADVREVALGGDGSAWVVAEKRSILRVAGWLALPLAAYALTLLVTGGLLVMWVKSMAEERLAADQAVVQAAGAVPGLDIAARRTELKKRTRFLLWTVPPFLIGFPFVVRAVTWGQVYLRSLWPGAPEWSTWVAALAPVALPGTFLVWRWYRKQSKSGRTYGREMRVVLSGAVFLFLINRLPAPHSLAAGVGFTIGCILLFPALLLWRDILAVHLTKKPWLSGEYDRALGRLRWLSFRSPTPQMLLLEGIIQQMAGRGAEAEQCLRGALSEARSATPEFRSRALCCLGFTLTDLGRYEESQRCMESVLAMGDKTGSARIGIADMLLEQGKEPEKALALIEEAIKIKKSRLALPERMGSKAWALALMGRQREMDEAVATALGATDQSLKAVAASVHRRIGKALVAAQRVAEAIEHFRTAVRSDPQGQIGTLSRLELERLGALGG
jgi:tetratricopeptide (TPR) repeat protein